MADPIVGVIAPGAMGAAVGGVLTGAGIDVRYAAAGHSDATWRRAAAVGITDVGDLAELVTTAEVLLSICPPHAAVAVAEKVATLGFDGIYVDANAVSPAVSRRIAAVVNPTAQFLDGGIIGGPPTEPGSTRLYLAGAPAAEVAAMFPAEPLEVVVLDGDAPAASALKVAYAAWTKGSAALLLATRALARAEGVEAELVEEWAHSQPGLAERTERLASSNAPKAWRFVGEMQEVAASFESAGLPAAFHLGAAEVYNRLKHCKDAADTNLDEALNELLDPRER